MKLTRTLLPVVLAGTLAAAGCGSDDGGSDGDNAVAPSTSAPGATETSKQVTVPAQLKFTAKTLDGKSFDGESLAGKPVVFWFWAPWCPKCKGEAPAVAKAAKKYDGKVTFVGVSGKAQPPAMKTFVKQTGTGGFTQLQDAKGEVWRKFKVTVQSSYVLMDSKGKTEDASGPLSESGLSELVDKITG